MTSRKPRKAERCMLPGAAVMFAGNIHEQTIIADQPVLVLDGEAIVNSFARVEEATDFLLRTRNDSASILRHNGLNWDILPRVIVRQDG